MDSVYTKKRTGHYITAVILVILGVALDQFTKRLAVTHLKGQESFVIFKNVFELQYLENRGAAFGLLQNQKFLFLICVVVISIVILWFYLRVPMTKRFFPLRLCAVFIMAGAIGNCIDRVVQSFVVDFLYFSLIDFPVFNVADIYVTVATFVLVFLFLFYYKEEDLEVIYQGKERKADKA